MEALELVAAGPNEHIAHEQGMIGTGADDANIDPVSLVPSGKPIDDVDTVSRVEIVDGAFSVDSPDLCRGTTC